VIGLTAAGVPGPGEPGSGAPADPRDTPPVPAIEGSTRVVGILGWPVEHSLSPRMQNAAFAAAGLDWVYVALPTPPERLGEAIDGLVALGFAGANVTAPHKVAAAAHCAAGLRSVNTLVVRDGAVQAYSTDAAILDGLPAERPVVLGDGGAAAAFLEALPHARTFSRRGDWPPDVSGADLVVNATAARDAVLVELGEGQTLVDLPYPETATAKASRAAGATVVTGLDVLAAQGAAAFELWTGQSAPLAVMREAIGAK
jgi:shikimate dehydrogenase